MRPGKYEEMVGVKFEELTQYKCHLRFLRVKCYLEYVIWFAGVV